MIVKRSDFYTCLREITKCKRISVDTETYGLRYEDRLFAVIVASGTGVWYFNFKAYAGLAEDFILSRDCLDALVAELSVTPFERVYMANAKFDMHKMKWNPASVWDVLVVARVIKNNRLQPYSLDSLGKEYLGIGKDDKVEEYIASNRLYTEVCVEGKKTTIKNKHFDKVPFDLISTYAEQDAKLTLMLGELQEKLLEEELQPVVANERRLTRTIYTMEERGIKLDCNYAMQGLRYEQQKLCEAEAVFMQECGFGYSEAGMKKKLVARLRADGVEVPKTEKGNDSLTDDFLEELDHPVAQVIRDIRKHTMYAGTFYGSFLHYKDSQNIIRAHVKQAGTETGRMSYTQPNLQQVPKEDDVELPYYVRKCFVPRETFVMIDYDQQEYKLMLDYAGETKLIKEVQAGMDVHQATANLLGITRKQAKQINFSCLYGSGASNLASALGMSVREATEMKQMYFRKLPNVERLIQRVMRKGKERGYIKNYLGRHCHISDPEFSYILPNHLIQGSCADIVKIAMNQIDERFTKALGYNPMLVQVHDELLFDIPPEHYGIIKDVKEIMESAYKPQNGLGLTVSVDHSRVSWAHADKVKGAPGESRNKVQNKGHGRSKTTAKSVLHKDANA